MTLKQFAFQLLTFLVGLASFILFNDRQLFGLVGDDPIQIMLASFVAAILIFLFLERIILGSQLRKTEKEVLSTINAWKSSIPHFNVIRRFSTCDEALIYLSGRLQYASSVLNTKISRDNIPSGEVAQKKYDEAVKKALREDTHVSDIISSGFEHIGIYFKKYAEGKTGEYSYTPLRVDVPCFLNFAVMEYRDEDSEVVIGWATSQSFHTDQPAFVIRDQKMVEYFRNYHLALRASK